MSILLDGTQGIDFNDGSNQSTAATPYARKNFIINGDMRIDQRNAGSSVSTNNSYAVDRLRNVFTASGSFTAQQSTTAPDNFTNSVVWTVGSAASATSSEVANMQYRLEGNTLYQLRLGTSAAKTITLSFWVRSSVTGTYCAAFINSAADRAYVAEYSISSADTWEQKSITLTGDTSGTWLSTNGIGLRIQFDLGSGSDYNATADTWVGANDFRTTNQTDFINNAGATFYITGVQLEVGDFASDFEFVPYDMELARCQRYFERIAGDANVAYASGCATYGNQPRTVLFYKTQKRAVPTLSSSAASEFRFQFDNSVNTPSAITLASIGVDTAFLNATGITISVNVPCVLISNSSSSYLDFSSEL